MNSNSAILAYIGTYTEGESEGIYVLRLDAATGELAYSGKVSGVVNPTYLAIDSQQRYLYAVNTIEGDGMVSAFEIDSGTGLPRYLNQQSSGGSKPIHLVVEQDNQFLLAANFGSGSVSVLPIREDGSLGELSDFIQHEGASVHPVRQQGPHVHSITLDNSSRYAVAAEYGADQLIVYRFEPVNGRLNSGSIPPVQMEPGAGPRHFAFHPHKRWAYVINELSNTIASYDYNPDEGILTHKESVSALPVDYTGRNNCADVQVNAAGTFVYGSNRGHDSIVIYAVNPATGGLEYVGHEPTQGKEPRSFIIDPTGKYMLVAHQATDNIVVFGIDNQTGRLHPTGHSIEIPMPVCIKMISLPLSSNKFSN